MSSWNAIEYSIGCRIRIGDCVCLAVGYIALEDVETDDEPGFVPGIRTACGEAVRVTKCRWAEEDVNCIGCLAGR